MVRKTSIFLVYAIVFFLALICFAPKSNMYYYLEHNIRSLGVGISSKRVTERCMALKLGDTNLYYGSINGAYVKESDVKPFIVYNVIKLKDIELSSFASSFMPLHVDKIKAVYTISDPLNIRAKASGEFGDADMTADLRTRVMHIVLRPSKIMLQKYAKSLKYLKRSKNGEYFYDKNF